MSINLTDEIEVKTKKGKLGAAKQIFLEGDTQTVENEIQDINSRHNDLNSKHESLSSTVSEHTNQIESNQNQITANKSTQDAKNASLDANMAKLNTRDDQITELVRDITATGGASVATTVTYDNTSSHLASATVQGAIDELQGSKIDKTSILQELGNAEDKVMSQKCVSQEIIQGEVYDISAHNNNAVFESLQALLRSSNLSTLIPPLVRHGGMSIKFIQGSVPSSDNKYVQYMYNNTSTAVADFTNKDNWEKTNLKKEVDQINKHFFVSSKNYATALSGRIIAAGEWNSRSDFITLVKQVYAGDVVRIIGKAGYSMNYAVYSEFNGTALDGTKVIQLGSVINTDFDLFVNITGDGYIATSSVSTYNSQDIFTQSSLSELKNEIENDIDSSKHDVLTSSSINGGFIWTEGKVNYKTGAITSSGISKYTNLISVHKGDVLTIRTSSFNDPNEVDVAAYDYNEQFIAAKSIINSTALSGYRIINYTVQDDVAFIRIVSRNNYADYNTAFPNDMPLISYNDGKEDVVSALEFLEKGFAASNFVHGTTQPSPTRKNWFYYQSDNSYIISTRAFPKDGIDYIRIKDGKAVAINQYDKDLQYIGKFSKDNALRKDSSEWLPNCKYFTLSGQGDVFGDFIDSIHYSYEDILIVKDSVIQTSSDYYDKKVDKSLFLNSFVINDYANDKMAHGSRVVLDDEGNILTPYCNSTTHESEAIGTSNGVVLAKCNSCNIGEPVRINAMVKGETVGDFTQSNIYAPYDPNLIKVSGSSFNVMMTLNDNTDTLIGIRNLNSSTMEMGDTITRCKIVYNSVEYPFTVASLNSIVDAHYKRIAGTTDIGTYPILSSRIKTYNGEKYTYVWSLNGVSKNFSTCWNGAIIKTADNGATWEIVSFPTTTLSWSSHTNWEAGFDILGNRAYVFFRNTSNDAPICYYDLNTQLWSDVVDLIPITLPYIASPNQTILADPSRPEICVYNGYIYAMQNVKTTSTGFLAKDVFRGMMCVWKLDSDLNVVDYKLFQNAFGVSYFSAIMGNGFGYFSFSEDRTAKHQTQDNYNKRHISLMPLEFGTLIW